MHFYNSKLKFVNTLLFCSFPEADFPAFFYCFTFTCARAYQSRRKFYESILEFREIRYCFVSAKFKYFAKQIIYLEFPDHPLQNDV